MYTIQKEFSFSAAHQLLGLEFDHPCGRLHGHNYKVVVVLESKQLTTRDWIRDYRDLDLFKQYIDKELDHRNLNEVLDPMPTTAEMLAWYFYNYCAKLWPEVTAVRVSETDKTWAEFRS